VVADGIVTPEAVQLELQPAGLASRMIAFVIDLAVQYALLVALFFGVGLLAGAGADLGGVGAALVYVGVFLVLFGYPIGFETLWRGRTLGKAALGLRVVTIEGAPIRFRHAAIRSILGLVDLYGTSGAVGVVAVLVTRRSQRLGDLVAGTIVLRERTAAGATRTLRPVRFEPPWGLEAYAATLPATSLTHEDYGTVRSFLLRAPSLAAGVRDELAAQLAQPLAARLQTTPPPGVPPEAFLLCVAAAFQRRMDRTAGRRTAAQPSESVWALPARLRH
jgi:uncharacterized RDD family membrane protein YckC